MPPTLMATPSSSAHGKRAGSVPSPSPARARRPRASRGCFARRPPGAARSARRNAMRAARPWTFHWTERMHFSLIHLADQPRDGEEVYVVVPDGSKTAIAVPLDALPEFLPMLEESMSGRAPPRCPACSAKLPALVLDQE